MEQILLFQYIGEQKKNRPEINIKIYEYADKNIWKDFKRFHYLSHTHNNAAKVFIATINDEIAGFLSVLHFPHPKVKNLKKVHPLVILPDYQGAGFGIKFLNEIGKIYKKQKQRYNIVTSAPSLIFALKKSTEWITTRYGRTSSQSKGTTVGNMQISKNRITASFELK